MKRASQILVKTLRGNNQTLLLVKYSFKYKPLEMKS
jgi:hypothetical protein